MSMKTLTKLLTTTVLATTLAFNSYSQAPKNTIVAYVSIQDKKDETILNVDSLKSYNLSFVAEKENLFDLMMGGKPKKEKTNTGNQIKLYIVKKTKKETTVIPTIMEGEYDFSKDSKEKIKKEINEFLKDEKINISDPLKYSSGEIFMELFGEEK